MGVQIYGYIYKIENLVNGKIYIGLTTTTPRLRKYHHFYNLKNERHPNFHLQHSFNKHGESNFKFTVLNYATNKKTLDNLEKDYIKYYNCLDDSKGYNLQSGGSNGKPSLVIREKMSRNHADVSGKKNPNYGKPISDEHRKRLSEFHKGRKSSLATRKKISKSQKGRKHTLETRKKISEAHTGKIFSEEHRKNLSKSKKGKKHTLDSRKKIAEAHRNKGLFGFTGTRLFKQVNPEHKCWGCHIYFNNYQKYLTSFQDPLSAQIVHDIVFKEIYS